MDAELNQFCITVINKSQGFIDLIKSVINYSCYEGVNKYLEKISDAENTFIQALIKFLKDNNVKYVSFSGNSITVTTMDNAIKLLLDFKQNNTDEQLIAFNALSDFNQSQIIDIIENQGQAAGTLLGALAFDFINMTEQNLSWTDLNKKYNELNN